MANIWEPRSLRSNTLYTDLADSTSDPDHIQRRTGYQSFYTTFLNPQHVVEEPTPSLKALNSWIMRALCFNWSLHQTYQRLCLNSFTIRIFVQLYLQCTREDKAHMYAWQEDMSLMKATEGALYNAFNIDYREVADVLKHDFSFF